MWPDKETEIDYLNFGYMVNLVANIFVTINNRAVWRLGQWQIQSDEISSKEN